MATGGQEEISNEDSDVVTGSETVFDHVCQPCSEETNKEAVGFCVDCAEWLCEECFNIHRKPKPSRHHTLKDIDEMKNLSLEIVDKCTEKCESHNGKKLKYFCPDHGSLGCSKCVIQSHGNCKIQHIPDVSKAVDTMNEFQQITAKLEAVSIKAKEIVSDLTNKVELVQDNKTETVKAFQSYKMKLVESLDNIEEVLEEQCEKAEEEETARLNVIAETCESNENESLEIKSQLMIFEQSGQHCNMFVALKRSKGNLKTLESSIKHAQKSSRVKGFTFRPNYDVETTLSGSGGIGTLIERSFRTDTDYCNTKTQHITDISIKTDKNNKCRISGGVLLPRGRLVLVDNNNCQVKVVDTAQNKMISELETDGNPSGVCKVSDDSVVVTISSRQRISFMTIGHSGDMSKSKDISVGGACLGIAVIDDRMVVSYRTPDKMEIMDMNGSVLHTIKTNDRGEDIFNLPQYVIPSHDKKYVYVSNLKGNTVICMKLDGTGTVLHEYKDEGLQGPEQVAVDSNGMCFVGGYISKNVHLITPDCKKVKVILGEKDGLKEVNAVCFCEESDRLYIGMAGCDIIKVFQLFF